MAGKTQVAIIAHANETIQVCESTNFLDVVQTTRGSHFTESVANSKEITSQITDVDEEIPESAPSNEMVTISGHSHVTNATEMSSVDSMTISAEMTELAESDQSDQANSSLPHTAPTKSMQMSVVDVEVNVARDVPFDHITDIAFERNQERASIG